uniref:Uncharacterized protein n=1 Tax=Glossina morsitans morsitans TaxID=37546 RepID=A0A1B0FNH7_GLOMM
MNQAKHGLKLKNLVLEIYATKVLNRYIYYSVHIILILNKTRPVFQQYEFIIPKFYLRVYEKINQHVFNVCVYVCAPMYIYTRWSTHIILYFALYLVKCNLTHQYDKSMGFAIIVLG